MVGMQAIMQMELLFIAVQKTFIIGMICAHFVQSRSPLHIPEHTRSAFWVCSQQSEVQKKALFDVRSSVKG